MCLGRVQEVRAQAAEARQAVQAAARRVDAGEASDAAVRREVEALRRTASEAEAVASQATERATAAAADADQLRGRLDDAEREAAVAKREAAEAEARAQAAEQEAKQLAARCRAGEEATGKMEQLVDAALARDEEDKRRLRQQLGQTTDAMETFKSRLTERDLEVRGLGCDIAGARCDTVACVAPRGSHTRRVLPNSAWISCRGVSRRCARPQASWKHCRLRIRTKRPSMPTPCGNQTRWCSHRSCVNARVGE